MSGTKGFAAGDDNLYRYVGNEPSGDVDPTGEDDNAVQQVIAQMQQVMAESQARLTAMRAEVAEALNVVDSISTYEVLTGRFEIEARSQQVGIIQNRTANMRDEIDRQVDLVNRMTRLALEPEAVKARLQAKEMAGYDAQIAAGRRRSRETRSPWSK